MKRVTKDGWAFLAILAAASGPVSRKNLPPVISREEDRARQAVRSAGYAAYKDGAGWYITDLGRIALKAPHHG